MTPQPNEISGHQPGTISLRDRLPGEAIMQELMRRQTVAPPRGAFARIFGLGPLPAGSASWYHGLLGEQQVGRSLLGLGPEWSVLHAVPVGAGDSDIDHVVIGPPGVFTINTKHHAGKRVWAGGSTFMVNGDRQPHIRNSEFEGRRAERQLRAAGADRELVRVTAIIAVVGAERITLKPLHGDVVIVPSTKLIKWLERQPRRLEPDRIASIAAVAERPSTWRSSDASGVRIEAVLAAFALLEREIRQARRVRRSWAFGLALAFVIAAAIAALT